MNYDLPTEFDVIVVGTGIVESMVSAAASRVGKRVLHIDSNSFYGGVWASFNLDGIHNLNLGTSATDDFSQLLEEAEQSFVIGNDFFDLKHFTAEWHVPEKSPDNETDEQEGKPGWTQESLLKESRRFNIDLTPKLQFARGEFVELLISSNIARYSEYRSVSRVLTWLNGQLESVPCSRSDVFANNKVSVIEKRMLMKLFLALDGGEECVGYENKTFRSFLKDKKLTANLIHYVLYAIAMGTDDMSCSEGVQSTKRFLDSLGRFGKTPFLFSMYGSGEITQGFCRLSAVFGGIYALHQPLKGLIFGNERFKGLVCGNQRINAEFLVMGAEKAPRAFIHSPPLTYISRAVFITNKSIMESEKEHLTLLLYPPEDGKNACIIIDMGTLTGTCPKDLFLVHMISRQVEAPKEDFKHCVENLFGKGDDSRPSILWSCYFSIPDSSEMDFKTQVPGNITICPGPDIDLDYDNSVRKAKEIFSEMYPDTEFLPRAPDPEEIVIEGEPAESAEEEVILKPEGSDQATGEPLMKI